MKQWLLSKTVEVSHTSKKKRNKKVEIGKRYEQKSHRTGNMNCKKKNMKKILNSNRNVQITIKMKYYLSSIRLEKVLEYDMKMLISTLGTNYVLLMIV